MAVCTCLLVEIVARVEGRHTIPSDILAEAHSHPVAIAQLGPATVIRSVRIRPGRNHDGYSRIAILDSSTRAGEALDLNRRASSVLPNGSAGCPGACSVPKAVSDDPPRDVSFFEAPSFHAGEVRVIRGLGVLCKSHSRQESGERKCRQLHCVAIVLCRSV